MVKNENLGMIQRGNAPFGFLTPLLIHTTGWSDKNWSWLFLSSTTATISGERLQGSRYDDHFLGLGFVFFMIFFSTDTKLFFQVEKILLDGRFSKQQKMGLDIWFLRLTCRTLFLENVENVQFQKRRLWHCNPKLEVVAEATSFTVLINLIHTQVSNCMQKTPFRLIQVSSFLYHHKTIHTTCPK